MFVKVINAPKDADALTAIMTLVTVMVNPIAVGVEKETKISGCMHRCAGPTMIQMPLLYFC